MPPALTLPSPGSQNSVDVATPEQPPDRAQFQLEARIIRELAIPGVLHEVLQLGGMTSQCGTKEYLEQLLRDCGQPTDPVEKMLLEQLVIAHQRIARLQMQAAAAKSLEEIKVYNGAACQLQAEFRRSTLALKTYREPTPSQQITFVKQQNLAQNQQVAFVDGQRGPAQPTVPTAQNRPDSKLTSNKVLDHVPNQPLATQPESRRSREAEPVPAARVDSGRARTPAASRACDPALASLDRPADGGWEGSIGCEWEVPTEGADFCAEAAGGGE